MRITLLLIVCLMTSFVRVSAQKNVPGPPAEKARIERLVGLAKIWGAVKYFHPFPAYRAIDWDKALIEAIPRVNAARDSQEYAAALDAMLSALGDPATRARVAGAAKTADSAPVATSTEPVRLENGVLMVEALAVAKLFQQDASRRLEFVTKTNQLAPQAQAVLLDLRGRNGDSELEYFLNLYLQSILPSLLDRDVALASLRYRVHNGYAPQSGGGSGGYYSALLTGSPETLAGTNKTKTPPIVVLVNEKTGSVGMIGGLQAAKATFVVQEGDGEAGAVTTTIKLPDAVEVTMRTAELVNSDGSLGLAPDRTTAPGEALKTAQRLIAENDYVSKRTSTASAFAPQISQKDKPYAEIEFPPTEYRLLALFRFWNVINYFFPYKDLIGTDWNEILPQYIARFEKAQDAAEYQTAVRELSAETHDSHVFVRNAKNLDEKIGMFTAPVLLRFVENQTIVTKVLDGNSPLKVGDAILTIDGEPVEKRREFFARITSASTPQALMNSVHFNLLRGGKDTSAKLTVRGTDGKTRAVEIVRSLARQDPKLYDAQVRATPVVSILPNGFAYVDLDRLKVSEVDKMFETIKTAPAVIFDMRGYPNGTAWSIAPRLTNKKSPIGALFSRPILEAGTFYDGELSNSDYSFAQPIPEATGDIYDGKVVVLINEDAISQAEHTCLFFEAARPDVVFVGTPTMGANGDVTATVLPGNLIVSFSGHNVRHADGRQLQRTGIQPTVRAEPTIRGIVDGRDEILDAAVKFLMSKK